MVDVDDLNALCCGNVGEGTAGMQFFSSDKRSAGNQGGSLGGGGNGPQLGVKGSGILKEPVSRVVGSKLEDASGKEEFLNGAARLGAPKIGVATVKP